MSGAVWLGDNRWAVIAPNNGAVGLVDFASGAIDRLGEGDTTVLRHPATIFTVGDTLYVSDWGLRQVSLWTLDDQFVRRISASDFVRGALPQARDATDRFYVELAARRQAAARDSAPVVRLEAALDHGDTVARLAPLDLAEITGSEGRRLEQRVFSGTDKWGVLPDGAVWVARVRQNRVDWRTPDGQWTEGSPLPDRVLEVTRYDREMFVRKFPPELRATAQQLPFAPFKPPFDDAFSGADGTVWLVKSRAPIDSMGQYHVVGRDGRLRRDVQVPGHVRLVGASSDAAIGVESAKTGIRLLRFVLPPLNQEETDER